MQTLRDAIRSTFRVIEGGKSAAPRPPAPMWGFITVQDWETGEIASYDRVEVWPRPDGSLIVRPGRGRNPWQDA